MTSCLKNGDLGRGTRTTVFSAEVFTRAKTWKQPKGPSAKVWIKKMWYIYAMEYYSAIKKNEIMSFATTWMDLEVIILSEISQTEKETIIYPLYMESKIWHAR